MPGATATPDVEVIVEDARGGGGGGGRPPDGGDGGDDGDYGKGWQREPPSPRRFSTGIAIAMVSILMFFMALASAFLLLHHSSRVWVAVHLLEADAGHPHRRAFAPAWPVLSQGAPALLGLRTRLRCSDDRPSLHHP